MLTTGIWVIVIAVALFAGLIGFIVGRRQAPNNEAQLHHQATIFEEQLAEKQAELDSYKNHVHQHYNKTAEVFKDMASSYKELFDHLSSGYEQLGDHSDKRILPERAGALLDGPEPSPASDVITATDKTEDALTR